WEIAEVIDVVVREVDLAKSMLRPARRFVPELTGDDIHAPIPINVHQRDRLACARVDHLPLESNIRRPGRGPSKRCGPTKPSGQTKRRADLHAFIPAHGAMIAVMLPKTRGVCAVAGLAALAVGCGGHATEAPKKKYEAKLVELFHVDPATVGSV